MDLLNTESESPHAVEDLVGSLDPLERSIAIVVRLDVCQDRRAQLGNARVRSAFQGFLGEEAKEALDEVQPRCVRGCEMKVHARVTNQPSVDGRRFVCGEIVEHDMDIERRLDTRVNVAKE